jgi:metal-responsive CopG/Arc/MetJ family transcriptional regulator
MTACREGTPMAHVKTAVSLDKSLFEQLESLAEEMQVSRSQLLGLALEDFLRRRQSQLLLEQLNTAYDDAPDPTEQTLLQRMRQQQRRLVEESW